MLLSNRPPPSPDEDDILRPEGVGPRVCAPGRPFVSFGLQKVMSFAPKVKVFKLVLLSDPSSPSGTLTLFSLEPCKRVREHFRGWELDPEVQSPTVPFCVLSSSDQWRQREIVEARAAPQKEGGRGKPSGNPSPSALP